MEKRKRVTLLIASFFVLGLSLLSFYWLSKKSSRETIFDRIVHIPKELVFDIPELPPLCDEIAGLKKGFVDIKDGKLYYEEEGQGIPLVLVVGGPGETHHPFHPHFSLMKDIARVIYYDQRGVGKSSKDETGKTYTIKQAVQDLDQLRKALNIDKWVVLGWSYGGFLAQCYVLTYPECCMGLVLVASEHGLPKVEMKPGRQGMFLSEAEKKAISDLWAKYREGKITELQASYHKELSGDWKKQGYYKPTQEEMIRSAFYEWGPAPGFRELISPDKNKINLAGKFDDFEIPTLIAEATWDLTWDTDKTEFMRKNHPHAQVEVFEKSGHKLFADEPEKFFGLLRPFLKEVSTKQITTKPGHRLSWPEPTSDLARKLVMANALKFGKDKKNKLFLEAYEQALAQNVKSRSVWGLLIAHFINSKSNYEKCLMALQKLEAVVKKEEPEFLKRYGYFVTTWQGHMLDLLGKRAEALKHYQDALKTKNITRGNFFPVRTFIDRPWLQERLKAPFTWD